MCATADLFRNDQCFAGNKIPDLKENDYTRGVENTDLIIIMDASDRGSCTDSSSTLAHASPCELHPKTYRPIKGLVVICSGKVQQQGLNLISTVSTLIHEIMHILVFSPEILFERFRDETGNKYAKSVITEVRRGWKYGGDGFRMIEIMFVRSPRVKAAARQYTGCDDLEGAELENGGSEGTSKSHWEKRIFGPELMTGVQSPTAPFSAITAALLEDSGWYSVNSSTVEDLKWGKGLGCNFARKSCREYIDGKPDLPDAAYPYCNFRDYVIETNIRLNKLRCSRKRDYVRTCMFKTNETIDKQYKVFYGKHETLDDGRKVSGDHVIGDDELTDYCPMWKINQRGSEKKRESDGICSHSHNQLKELDNYGLELFGKSSRCFEQDTLFVKLSCVGPRLFGRVDYAYEKAFGAGCYDHKCERGRLFLRASGISGASSGQAFKVCWAKGSSVVLFRYQKDSHGSMNLYKGTILCPSCQEICEVEDNDFKCAPEVEGITATDPLVSPCWSKSLRPHIANSLILVQLVHFTILAYYF
ncbi:leishmanolysin superfamily [Trichuris trichiura]|uniref:Leishmanolysin-like peptidase n=1 Tax=Trichuris trichiura TaxID=36087 RepID=A0A077YZZ2_TRITR|nr:leishmanolysin superfamily [Trichuris trichiura]